MSALMIFQIENTVDNDNEDSSMFQTHWKGVKIRHSSFCLVGRFGIIIIHALKNMLIS